MARIHPYTSMIQWTGNRGMGTKTYTSYDRTWSIVTDGKPPVSCSNDPLLGGDPALHNPEDLLLSSIAACHMLWFLHLASTEKIIVERYVDQPVAQGESHPDGSGRFLEVTLRPSITLAKDEDRHQADGLHARIHPLCYIANSVNFPVRVKASYCGAEQ